MLVLGTKHEFTRFEKQRLDKRFGKVSIIAYKNKTQQEVLTELEKALKADDYKVLVLNTKAKVGDDIIKYLTNLQFTAGKKQPKIMSIEHFLEKYLQKCYIPEDHKDLHFLEDIKPYNAWQYIQKRVIDYLGGGVLALTAKLFEPKVRRHMQSQSPGKLYFTQTRVGKGKAPFTCYKFRTMHEDSYHDPYTKEDDDRVYPYGEFLRKTRIDELPQYKNILKGQMHLIGPRAEWDILVQKYEHQIPYYNERHLVAPGISGWAQVMYPYGSCSEDAKQKLMYDLYYIKYWSLWLEIKVIFKTIKVVLGKKGV
ncbi:MAG: sugar transferase [Candidatus Muiribacteriota bacterium]